MEFFNPALPSIVESLDDLYKNFEKNKKRYEELNETFSKIYNGDKPIFYFRAPGRVNLIGEHVDYSGYCVLPFALEQDTIVAVSFNKLNNDIINIHNCNEKYTPMSIDVGSDIEIDLKKHHWTNYVLAAWKGVQQALNEGSSGSGGGGGGSKLKSVNLLYSGNVPMGAGVSSSSALVCVSTLAISYCNNLILNKEELAQLSIKSERYVGVESGGMDQSISFLGEQNTAKLIEFHPNLKTYDVQLPKGVSFVICNSLVDSLKVITGATNYNLRVVECRLAAVLLAYYTGLSWEKVRRLRDVQHQGNYDLNQLIQLTEQYLSEKQTYTREEVASILDISVEQLVKTYFPSGITVQAEYFELYKRARHVFTETQRVYQFSEICKQYQQQSNNNNNNNINNNNNNNNNNNSDITPELGKLMNESHESCSKLFECSCPELDILTKICRDNGALGSRLTGAGWGGCVISLVPNSKVDSFLDAIDTQYYSKFVNPEKLKNLEKSSYSFFTTPCKGACIISSSV
ncbi:hypothetical protein RB653_005305 [Dictyostelium firmibasis]|uniref:Galactokinase n=1 Tax=Dictyostelium firmibasis TaxID=79012 RepID=A0AAN7U7H2_9MYCE